MKRKYAYSYAQLVKRLLAIAKPIRSYLAVSTLASITGSLSHMGLMTFGACTLLSAAGVLHECVCVYFVLSLICALLIAICRYLEGVYSHIGAYGILAKLRVHLYECLAEIAPAGLIDRKAGDIMNIAVPDIETLEHFFAHTIGPMFTLIILPVTSILAAYHYHALYAWILIPVYIIISVLLPLLALKTGRGIGMQVRTDLGQLKAVILESVYGIKDIQIFGAGERKRDEVMELNEEVNRSSHLLTLHRQFVSSLPNFFVYLARILIAAGSVYLIGRGEFEPSGLIIVSYLAASSFSSTFSLTFVVTHLLEAFAAAERIFIIEDTLPQVCQAQVCETVGEIRTITMEDVSFRYPGSRRVILDHVALTIHKGEHIGIIGESGAGKSTILRLLLRFYDPTSGIIRFNDMDEKKLSFQELHQRVGLLEQDTYLFDGTIAQNIAMGDDTCTMEDIRSAAKRAGISDLIETLPDGYDTQMGMMGSRLSGGERQRIGIARIILRNPDIVIMDEPSSALDAFHEKELLQTLRSEYRDRTLILISHRESTLAECHRILKLENGHLIEQ